MSNLHGEGDAALEALSDEELFARYRETPKRTDAPSYRALVAEIHRRELDANARGFGVDAKAKSLDVGKVIAETFRVYKRAFVQFTGIVLTAQGVIFVLEFALQREFSHEELVGNPAAALPIICVFLVISGLMVAAIMHATHQCLSGESVRVGLAYRMALRRFPAIIVAELCVVLRSFLLCLTIVGIPFAIQRAVRWDFIWQAALIEKAGPSTALRRSSDLVAGCWWRVFGLLVLGIVLVAVLDLTLGLTLGLVPIVGLIVATLLGTPPLFIFHTIVFDYLRTPRQVE